MDDIKFDFSDFESKFAKVAEDVPKLMEIGLGRAMLQLLNDCVMATPTVPLREGWLRGSGSIFVQNRLVAMSTDAPKAKAKFANADSPDEPNRANYLVGVIGFNAPYAAEVHEGVGRHFREPGSGAKFLESKMLRFRNLYMKIVAAAVVGGGHPS